MKTPKCIIVNRIYAKLGAYGYNEARSNTERLEIAKNVETALKTELANTMNLLRAGPLSPSSVNNRFEAEDLGAHLQVVREKIAEIENNIAEANAKESMIKKASEVMQKARAEIAELSKLAGVPMTAVYIRASVFHKEI